MILFCDVESQVVESQAVESQTVESQTVKKYKKNDEKV